MYFHDRTRQNSRAHDWGIINSGLQSKDPNVRRQAECAKGRIVHESGKVESMRQSLIKAHRNGDKNQVKDIHEFIRNKSEYKNT